MVGKTNKSLRSRIRRASAARFTHPRMKQAARYPKNPQVMRERWFLPTPAMLSLISMHIPSYVLSQRKHMSLKRLLYLCHLRYSDRRWASSNTLLNPTSPTVSHGLAHIECAMKWRRLQQKQAARLQRRQKGQPKQWCGA